MSKRAITLAENDPYFLSLQRQEILLKQGGNIDTEVCVKQLMKIRLGQLRQVLIKMDKGKERINDFFVRRFPFLRTLCNQSETHSRLLLSRLQLDEDAVFTSLAA